ncbi:MAG: CubicO group peptidase (beta-lactamase class C family) [Planctomycetota bacterium]|jgi:CubicO group peptidase (beta-lactamase class C family)
MNRRILCFLVMFTTLSVVSIAQQRRRQPPNKYETLMREYAQLRGFSGTILVAKGNEILYRGSVGLANRETSTPNRTNTRFRIGSISKSFTAALIMRFVDKGALSLKDPITKFLPEYRKDIGDKITIHHLLCHSSGLPNFPMKDPVFRDAMRHSRELASIVKQWCSTDLQFEPGEGLQYSNAGYVVLAAIVEAISKKKFDVYLKESLLIPLGLKNTGQDYNQKIVANRAQGHKQVAGVLIGAEYLDMSVPIGAGGLYSTVDDLHKWDRAISENRVLSNESKLASFDKQAGKYGYGWFRTKFDLENGTIAHGRMHGGNINGFSAIHVHLEENKGSVVVLANIEGRIARELSRALVELALSSTPAPAERREDDVFWRFVHTEDHDTALSLWRKIGSHNKMLLPNLMDNAQALIRSGNLKEAAAVLRFAIKAGEKKGDSQKLLATILNAETQAPQFVELHEALASEPMWSEGVHPCDVNQDGKLDIIFANCNGWHKPGDMAAPSKDPLPPTILVNFGSRRGRPVFKDMSASYLPADFRVHAKNLTLCDVDGDGYDDIVFAVAFGAQQRLLRFDPESKRYIDETKTRLPELILNCNGVSYGDFDCDGDLDLVFVDSGPNSDRAPGGKARLLLNDGKGHFTDDSARLNAKDKVGAQNAKVMDIDGDLDLDIVVDGKSQVTQLYINDGNANFTFDDKTIPSAERGGQPYEIEWADLDNDGDLDAVHMSWGGDRRNRYMNVLLRNNLIETGKLSFAVVKDGFEGRNNEDENEFAFLDVNNDGFLDLIVATLISSSTAEEKVFINSGKFAPGFMKQKEGAFSVFADGTLDLTVADFDGDGRADIVTAQGESKRFEGFENRFYRNNGPADTLAPRFLRSMTIINASGETFVRVAWQESIQDDGESQVFASAQWEVKEAGKKVPNGVVQMKYIGGGIYQMNLKDTELKGEFSLTFIGKDRAGNQVKVAGPTLSIK